jgi:DNA polymerase-3 subunit beta
LQLFLAFHSPSPFFSTYRIIAMKIYTTLSALKAIAILAADNDIRYYLNGVQITANATETRLAATDGHVLGIHRSEQQNENIDFVEFILPLDVIKLLKPAYKNIDSVVIDTDGLTGTITAVTGATINFSAIDGKFPDIQRVIPHRVSGEVSQFKPALLDRFAKAAKLLGSKNQLIHVAHNGNSAALVHLDVSASFVGVVMPFRSFADDGESKSPPAWAINPMQKPVANAA